MRKGDYFIGLVFIIIGAVFLLNNFGYIDIDFRMADHWPLALLIPGLIFELGYFVRRKDPGLLVPGGILLTYGAYFYLNTLYEWTWMSNHGPVSIMSQLWPVFPLGVAFGLFQLYLFGGREKALLIPIGILGGFSLVALSFTVDFIDFGLVAGVALVLLGLLFLLRKK